MVREFYNLYKLGVGVDSGGYHAAFDELLAVGIIELVAVAVAFLGGVVAVGFCRFRIRGQSTGVCAQTHGAAHLREAFLLLHQVDDRVGRVVFDLGAVGFFQSQNIAGELDHGTLHAQANSKEGNAVFSGISDGFDFAVNAA